MLSEGCQSKRNCVTNVILVRHGQTEWNRVERFRGHADVALNEAGLAQAEAAGERIFRQWKPSAVYASPLSRAVKTAEAIAKHYDLPVQVHPELIDIDFGKWQGLTPDEVQEQWPDEHYAWYHSPELAQIPDGETLDALRARAMRTVNELVSRHPGQTIVIVGHTVINRIILLGVLGLDNDRFWHLSQDTGAINVFEAESQDFFIASLNDTSHLYGI